MPLFLAFSVLAPIRQQNLFSRAASINRSSMLSASFLSSLVGLVITLTEVDNTTIGHHFSNDEQISFSSEILPNADGNATFIGANEDDSPNLNLWSATFNVSLTATSLSLLLVIVIIAPFKICKVCEGTWRRHLRIGRKSPSIQENNEMSQTAAEVADTPIMNTRSMPLLEPITNETNVHHMPRSMPFVSVCQLYCLGCKKKSSSSSWSDTFFDQVSKCYDLLLCQQSDTMCVHSSHI